MQVILDSLFTPTGSAPLGSGKIGEFWDWTRCLEFGFLDAGFPAPPPSKGKGPGNEVVSKFAKFHSNPYKFVASLEELPFCHFPTPNAW